MTIEGSFNQDTVIVAGIPVTGQKFAAVTSAPGDAFSDLTFDGILGMGFPALASVPGNPVTQTMISRGLVPAGGVYGFWLSWNLGANGGELALGAANTARYSGSITWAPLTSPVYWSVSFGGLRYGNRIIYGGQRAIIDTGTSLIVGPSRAVNQLHQLMGAVDYKGWGLYQVSCSRISSFPSITLSLGGRSLVLTNQQYTLRYDGLCFSGFAPGDFNNDEGLSSWIMGDVLQRPYYTIYDVLNRRVGFARSVQ